MNNNPIGIAYRSSGAGANGGIVSSIASSVGNINGTGIMHSTISGGISIGSSTVATDMVNGSTHRGINWPKANVVSMTNYS